MKYKDFSIKVGQRRAEGFAISVASPAGEANDFITATRELDEIFASLPSVAQNLGGDEAGPGSEPVLTSRDLGSVAKAQAVRPIDIGRKLFGILIVGRVRTLFDQSIGGIQGTDYGLRIKLHIDPENSDIARLASLPWELLYREETRDYLSLSSKTPLVRYLDVQRPFELLPFKPPLRILVVVANPSGTEPLNLEKERQGIEQSWGNKADVEVDFLETATIHELNRKLVDADYHVLHYMGHGGFDPKQGVGVLAMEDENGKMDLLDGRTLGIMLRDETSIRLVFLNACDTGKLGNMTGQDPFAGVATALVMAGVPAVVAMQFPISDGAALAFTECFYPQIARGVPVDASVAEGRKAIRVYDRKSMEWAIPVLFMRSPDGYLFIGEARGQQQQDNKTSPDTPPIKKTGRTRTLAIGAMVAAVLIIAGVVNFPHIKSWFSSEENAQQTNGNETSVPDVSKPDEGSELANDVIPGSHTPPANLATCGKFVELQKCEPPLDVLAGKICAAYSALESGGLPVMGEEGEILNLRPRKSLYVKKADDEAMQQFIANIRQKYMSAYGKDVVAANIENPREFWKQNTEASIVLDYELYKVGPETPDGSIEIPDASSTITYNELIPLNLDFKVTGSEWGSVRAYYGAAFWYFDAIAATDKESQRNSLDQAVLHMTHRCSIK